MFHMLIKDFYLNLTANDSGYKTAKFAGTLAHLLPAEGLATQRPRVSECFIESETFY